MFNTLKIAFAVLLLLCTICSKTAYAYLNPGTGSCIFQIIIAALLGGLFTIKLSWNKIKTFFKSLFSKGEKAEKK